MSSGSTFYLLSLSWPDLYSTPKLALQQFRSLMYSCIRVWQKNSNICPPIPPPKIFLCLFTLHSLIQQALSPQFLKFRLPLAPCTLLLQMDSSFPFRVICLWCTGALGLTTCLWMLGMASVLSRIFFFLWRGELEVAASGGCPCRHLLCKTEQKRRRGEEIRLTGSGFKAWTLQIFAWHFKIDKIWQNGNRIHTWRLSNKELKRRK